jgi:hypothetical protein
MGDSNVLVVGKLTTGYLRIFFNVRNYALMDLINNSNKILTVFSYLITSVANWPKHKSGPIKIRFFTHFSKHGKKVAELFCCVFFT